MNTVNYVLSTVLQMGITYLA